jgi:hypothetical protein
MRLACFGAFIALLLSGCASTGAPAEHVGPQLSKARWEGQVTWNYVPDAEGRGQERHLVIVDNCDATPKIAFRMPDGRFGLLTRKPEMASFQGTHVLRDFSAHRGNTPGWVESFTWTLFEIDGRKLAISHMRSVNNRGAPEGDELRYYFAHGTGVLAMSHQPCAP